MIYIEILSAIIVLLILVAIVLSTIPMQRNMLEEALRQEKAQLKAENIFWETIDDTVLKNLPDTFSINYQVEVDGNKYIVTISAEKFQRQK
ncbi:hypothetical protein H17ap60334_07603 [Thermosipho africanus H17ap60334]|uniref:Type II secretion system protein n=6 Tax=Fervidobacterium TaxID=2422 RepID=A7HNG5_FERNB|nr:MULTISPECIES: hypothetical protein [Fervidobacteriaceae]PHJ14133.1 hypothetical protein IM41_02585 [Fervidobacterium sp. SC_NGM5_G05]UXF01279.1 hypothetical protein IB67_06950 [Fervidobacterium riparium]ABS61448.1 hypothetical protein Fnod_1606 [Fervidobacterium nodosum Rt17-B1]AFG34801.1 hypothetical protein Ferpe_0676 [Fervidobacterium pennivorans DSM 9078]AFG34844.1 hypothetical protein Ferpe_0722 [Fervidobacterium pennivorans DSM 9078]